MSTQCIHLNDPATCKYGACGRRNGNLQLYRADPRRDPPAHPPKRFTPAPTTTPKGAGLRACPLCNTDQPTSNYTRWQHNRPEGGAAHRQCNKCQATRATAAAAASSAVGGTTPAAAAAAVGHSAQELRVEGYHAMSPCVVHPCAVAAGVS